MCEFSVYFILLQEMGKEVLTKQMYFLRKRAMFVDRLVGVLMLNECTHWEKGRGKIPVKEKGISNQASGPTLVGIDSNREFLPLLSPYVINF